MNLTIAEFVWFVGFSFLCGMGLVSIIWAISEYIWYKKFTKHLNNKED